MNKDKKDIETKIIKKRANIHEKSSEIINIQEIGGHSKAYQVKQIREIIINYKLEIQEDDES